jgi:hypothetical protein
MCYLDLAMNDTYINKAVGLSPESAAFLNALNTLLAKVDQMGQTPSGVSLRLYRNATSGRHVHAVTTVKIHATENLD